MTVQNLRIDMAGPLRIEVDGSGVDIARLGRLGTIAFSFLALERGRAVSRDELAEVVWDGCPPPTWPDSLRGVVARVRTVLDVAGLGGAGTLGTTSGCYRLCLPIGATIDVEEGAAALGRARDDLAAGGRASQAAEASSVAVSLLVGSFLAGVNGHWVEQRQRVLSELRVDALEVLSEAAAASGDAATAVVAASEAVALQPFRESAHLRLMAAHAAAGNRAEALRAYERCRRRLADELGVSPSPLTEAAYIHLVTDAVDRPSPAPGGCWPGLPSSITSFVGRASAIADVRQCLRSSRLVSLVGVGGMGKSRLALEVAAEVSEHHDQGAWLIELAGLGDPGLVPAEVLGAVGGPGLVADDPTESLVGHLGSAGWLLVLDNCEHVVEACADLAATLLRRCAGVHILCTTRERLRVPGEMAWSVPPLTVEPPASEAARLFVDRAMAVAPGPPLADAADPDVAAIVRLLDGIPLAIELAAGWASVLSVADIARRLNDRFELLVSRARTAPARHRTLRVVLDWSYGSLSPQEAATLRGLSVFAGGFTLDAAAEICGSAAGGVLRALSSLVDKSLVLVDRSEQRTRYRQLETVRQYASARLDEAGDADRWRRRHLRWTVALAEASASALEGPDQARWLDALDADHDNLRAALDRVPSDAGDAELGGRLAAALFRFWEVRGYWTEGRSCLSEWAGRADVPAPLRATILNAAAGIAQHQGDYAAARGWYEACLSIRLSEGGRLAVAGALHGLANIAFLEDDLPVARSRFEENLALARELGADAMVAASLQNLGVIEECLIMRGVADRDMAGPRARALFVDSLSVYERRGDRRGMALSLENLGTLSWFLGEYEEAKARQEASLAIRRELGDRPGIAASARALTRLALRMGDGDGARRLSEEYLGIERELGGARESEALAVVAEVAAREGRYDEARALLDRSVALAQRGGDAPAPAWIVVARADVACRQRDFAAARDALEDLVRGGGRLDYRRMRIAALARLSLVAFAEGNLAEAGAHAAAALADQTGARHAAVVAQLCEAMAGVALEAGQPRIAAELLGAAEVSRGRLDPHATSPYLALEHDATTTRARGALGDTTFAARWAIGAARGEEQIVEHLRGVVRRVGGSVASGSG